MGSTRIINPSNGEDRSKNLKKNKRP